MCSVMGCGHWSHSAGATQVPDTSLTLTLSCSSRHDRTFLTYRPRMRRGRVCTTVVVTLLGIGAPSACDTDEEPTPEPGPLTVQDGDFTTGVAYPANEVYSFAEVRLCADGGQMVDLLSLTPVGATEGASVSNFDVVTIEPEGFASNARPLDRIKSWSSQGRRVSEPCSARPSRYLAIEVRKRTEVASFASFVLTYRAGDDEYEVPVELPVNLCSDLDARACDF